MTLAGRLRSTNLFAAFDQAIASRDVDMLRLILRQACGSDEAMASVIDRVLELEWPVGVEVARRFDVTDWPEAGDLLARVRLPFLDAPNRLVERTRVKLAIVKLAAGDVPKLRRWCADATTDWRDVLVASGWAHGGWRRVMVQDGYLQPPEDDGV